VDFAVKKNVMVTERVALEFSATFSSLFNHNQLSDPYLILGDSADWGGLGGFSSIYNGRIKAGLIKAGRQLASRFALSRAPIMDFLTGNQLRVLKAHTDGG
jgi:hypothetical protein